jgi:argonaute-like protein implicated in RNA metabolism and viral defense
LYSVKIKNTLIFLSLRLEKIILHVEILGCYINNQVSIFSRVIFENNMVRQNTWKLVKVKEALDKNIIERVTLLRTTQPSKSHCFQYHNL